VPVILSLQRASDDERRFWRKTIEVGVQEKAISRAPLNIWNAAARSPRTIERARAYARDAQQRFRPVRIARSKRR
jgi:hypothetical protein